MRFREVVLSVFFVLFGVSVVVNLAGWVLASLQSPGQGDVFFYQAAGCFVIWSLLGTQLDAVRAVDLLRSIERGAVGGVDVTGASKRDAPRIVRRCPACKKLTYASHCCGTRANDVGAL